MRALVSLLDSRSEEIRYRGVMKDVLLGKGYADRMFLERIFYSVYC